MCDLVRDKWPEIDNDAQYAGISQDELSVMLKEKLKEEVDTYLETDSLDNMAEILEVLSGIMKHKGMTLYDLEKKRIEKYGVGLAYCSSPTIYYRFNCIIFSNTRN